MDELRSAKDNRPVEVGVASVAPLTLPSMPPPRHRPSSDRMATSGGSKIRPLVAEQPTVVVDQHELPVVHSATIALKTAKLSLTHQNWREILKGLDLVRALLLNFSAQVKPHSREILAYLGLLLDNGSLAKAAAAATIRCCQEYASILPAEFEKHGKSLIPKVASKYSHGDPTYQLEAQKALDAFAQHLAVRLVLEAVVSLNESTASRMSVAILTEGLLEHRANELREDDTFGLDGVIARLLEDESQEVQEVANMAKQKLVETLAR
eukprot:c20734_g2_i2.p1 GENE.c20734_g2_i2~~c20734_g2_i2.p1  ORF type:complete len:266 (-),score=56.14 c20734_g2_i2:35-832(-)